MAYSPTLRSRRGAPTSIRKNRPLTEEEIRKVAPSVFATEKHHTRSDRYTFLPTATVIEELRQEGFAPFMATQSRTRIPDRREFTKHMLGFRHVDQDPEQEESNEILFINSHDGASQQIFLPERFRRVCSNGLVVGSFIDDIRIRHSGDPADQVIAAAHAVVEQFAIVDESRNDMDKVVLTDAERQAFAELALKLKWPDNNAPIPAHMLLKPRNYEERPASLWSTFNIVQSNLINGGLRGLTRQGKTTNTREVRGIDQNVRLNRKLWDLAQKQLQN